jgi:hypothetical protein
LVFYLIDLNKLEKYNGKHYKKAPQSGVAIERAQHPWD